MTTCCHSVHGAGERRGELLAEKDEATAVLADTDLAAFRLGETQVLHAKP
jgi:hypothetical protein